MYVVAGIVIGFVAGVITAGMGYETGAGFVWLGCIIAGIAVQVHK